MYTPLARFLYFAAQAVRREPVRRAGRELEASQHWSSGELDALQWSRQLRLLHHAYDRAPHYRDALRRAGVHPNDVRSRQDWARLPVLEKRDLQDRADRLLCPGTRPGVRACTSGSSGVPVEVERSQESWAHAHANVIRAWRWHGHAVGEPYAYVWGVPATRTARLKARLRDALFNRIRGSAFDLGADGAARLFGRLLTIRTRFAVGYPSALVTFAGELDALGLDARRIGWRTVICTAELLSPCDRDIIARAFGARVVDSYGCAEAGVAGFECEFGTMHVPVESVVVDRRAAEVPGYEDVLLTDLHNVRQPLIRYRVGDLVAPAEPGSCPCGRVLPALGRLIGRSADLIRLADGRVLNPHVTTYLLKREAHSRGVREFQFVQFADGRIELQLVPGPGWRPGTRARLIAGVRDIFGQDVELREVGAIARSPRGKHLDFLRVAAASAAPPTPPPAGTAGRRA